MNGNDLIQEWFQIAREDLLAAKYLVGNIYPKLVEISCFHCQQSAEKALKGYLLFQDNNPPRIHNLRILCQMCMDIDNSFNTLLAFCSDLTPHGVEIRYPDRSDVDEAMAKQAIAKAEEIYNFCYAKLPKELKLPEEVKVPQETKPEATNNNDTKEMQL
jgi:HEPN domain-containing protein